MSEKQEEIKKPAINLNLNDFNTLIDKKVREAKKEERERIFELYLNCWKNHLLKQDFDYERFEKELEEATKK